MTSERKHIQVAHQERYQLRRRIHHIKMHKAGKHTHKIIKCDMCNPIQTEEVTKNV